MRALITGCAGFVGRHMITALQRRGYVVHGSDLRPVVDRPLWQADAHRIFNGEFHSGTHFDLVVHCAYHIGGRAGIDGTNLNLARNLALDAAMFDWAVRTGQGRVLYFSSSAAYPVALQTGCQKRDGGKDDNHGHDWQRLIEDNINLDDVWQPDASYGWAKLTGERLAKTASQMGLPVHVVRPFSGYGSDQGAEYPFPAIVSRARLGDLTVWGPPGQTRDWIHIDDVVEASLTIVEHDERRPVNLCSGVGVEMGNLASAIAYRAGTLIPESKPIYQLDKPTGVLRRVGNPNRMFEHYRPRVDIETGIRRALESGRSE